MLNNKALLLGSALSLTIIGLSACGGSSDSSGSIINSVGSNDDVICSVSNSTIALADGERCEISDETASLFNISAGEISCESGNLTFGGSTFSSNGTGLLFNGLTLICRS